jgi:hypothetical protein
MKKLLTAFTALTLALPAAATATTPDNGLMTSVPGFGASRVETVSYCLTEARVTRYQDLITDTEVEVFAGCMRDLT